MSYEANLMGKRYYRNYSIDTLWSSPSITANGTLGGAGFAVSASSNYLGYALWVSFVKNQASADSVGWKARASTGYIILYNPTPIKASHLHGSINWTSGQVYGSNNGTNWTQLNTFSYSAVGVYNVPVTTSVAYKYYKFNIASTVSNREVSLGGTSQLAGYTNVSGTTEIFTPDYDSSVDAVKGYSAYYKGKTYKIEKGV